MYTNTQWDDMNYYAGLHKGVEQTHAILCTLRAIV